MNENQELYKYINILGQDLIDNDFDYLEEFLDRVNFCIENVSFWKERGYPNRAKSELECLIRWMLIFF